MPLPPTDGDAKAAAWHAEPEQAVLERLGTDGEGLTSEEAQRRLDRSGPNLLPEASGPSALVVLLRQVASPLMWALLLSSAVAIMLGQLEDGLVVLAVVVLNALIGFAQELRAGRAIAALAEMVAEPARVLRDGRWSELPAADVVRRRPGRRGAGRQGAGRRARAARHGAANPGGGADRRVGAGGQAAAPVASGAPLAERRSVLYAGTVVAAGSGEGVVIATGTDTELGRISEMLEQADELTTPLTRELDRVGRAITLAIVVAATGIAVVAALRGFPAGDAALAGISLAVAAVPEGLPCGGHDRAGHRGPADGQAQGDHPPPAGGRDARQHHRGRLRQDRHADAQRDDRAGAVDAGAGGPDPGPRRPRAGPLRRRRRAAARRRAVQRRSVGGGVDGRRGPRRPDRDGAARRR